MAIQMTDFICGKKAYTTGGLMVLLAVCGRMGWVATPDWVYNVLIGLSVIFLRDGIDKGPEKI